MKILLKTLRAAAQAAPIVAIGLVALTLGAAGAACGPATDGKVISADEPDDQPPGSQKPRRKPPTDEKPADDPVEPPAPPPVNPTPYAYAGVAGDIPPALCSRNGTVQISAITPAPAVFLPAGQTVTFTAVIHYAYAVTQNMHLELTAYDDNGAAFTFMGNDVAAVAGCAKVTVTLANFNPSGYTHIVAYPKSTCCTYYRQAAVYYVENAPYFRVTATSHRFDQVLPFDAYGDAWVTVNASWNLYGGDWYLEGRGASFSASDYFAFPDVATAAESSGYFTLRFHPTSCNDRFWTETFYLTELSGSTVIGYTLQWQAVLPDVLAFAFDRRLFGDDPSAVHGARIVNCTTTAKDVTLSANVPWLIPQGGLITVPASSAVDVTYAADPSGKPFGLTRGAIAIHPAPGTFSTLPISVDVVTSEPGGYAISNPAYAWLDDSAAADRAVVISSGDDVIQTVALPFAFSLFGTDYSKVSISTNGFVTLGAFSESGCCGGPKLATQLPRSIWVNWLDLWVPPGGEIRTATLGTAPARAFVITFANVADCCITTNPVTYQVALYEGSSDVLLQYQSLDSVGWAGINQGDGLHGLFFAPATTTAFRLHKN